MACLENANREAMDLNNFLQQLGFTDFFVEQLVQYNIEEKGFVIGRVTVEHKHSYRVLTEQGEWLATVSGAFQYRTIAREDYPAVGDFVLVEKMAGEERAIIHQLFERKSKFARKVAGNEIEEQIVAANVDIVFLVMSLNADFNVRRLERYLMAAWDSGAMPVVVLTKSDLCEEPERFVREAEQVALGVEVLVVSAVTGEGVERLKRLIGLGRTGALLGSSGAGKSTLVNVLLGTDTMKVSGIREDDAKGRHTTTHRELVLLPDGGCLIDTPGMRELQLWEQGDRLNVSFTDVESFAASCRYRDCEHKAEPGCEVQAAIADGRLERGRYDNYVKLQKELAYLKMKTDRDAQFAEKRKWKQISKGIRKKR